MNCASSALRPNLCAPAVQQPCDLPSLGRPYPSRIRAAGLSMQADRARTTQKKTKKERKYMSNNNGQKLAGKVAVVTGGSRGIGAAITRRLADDGATVAFTYARDADAAASVVKGIERDGGKAIAIQADAADADAVKA